MATSHDHLDKLLDTARSGDLEQFRRLVSETMCINEIHPITHETILEMLAREGLAEFVLYAVDQGASHWAACRGAAEGGHQALMNSFAEARPNTLLCVARLEVDTLNSCGL